MWQWSEWSERTKWTQIQNKIMRKNVQWSEWTEWTQTQNGQNGQTEWTERTKWTQTQNKIMRKNAMSMAMDRMDRVDTNSK